jgi:uncharacterized membrane protein
MYARRRLVVSLLIGLLASGVASSLAAWQITVLIGWCLAAGVFGGVAWSVMIGADGERTRALAAREDDSRVMADLVMIAACVASLVGVGFILLKARTDGGTALAGMTALGVLSIVMAWGVVHTVFTLRYADLYYQTGGGIDFNGDDQPDYRDFAYVAFTIGMTYQVSDTSLQTKVIRRAALRHSLLSFLFGTAVIAVMINIVAGLAR